MSDAQYVTLIGPVAGGRLGSTMTQRDLGGAISKWWWETEKALAPCWQDQGVLVGDASVPSKLDTDDAAAAAGRP